MAKSELTRKGLEVLAKTLPRSSPRKIVGVGKVASRVRDLGSNKKHLAGFGK